MIRLVLGDITEQDVEVIVNAANSGLMGGGGVDGAIHRAGGPAIKQECERIIQWLGSLPAGGAVHTGAGEMPSRWVIHTVGPVWQGGGHSEADILAEAYRNSLTLALELEAVSLAFPSISTGVYGYPVAEAARVALDAVRQFIDEDPGSLEEILFVLHDAETFKAYEEAIGI